MDHTQQVSLGLDHYARVVLRQWRLIALVTVLGFVASAVYLVVAPRTFTAKTTLNLNIITTEPFKPQRAASGLLDRTTEVNIARSQIVAERAATLIGDGDTAREIRHASEVRTSADATVVDVIFSAPSADQAIDGADAVAKAYLDFRSEQAQVRVDSMLKSYNDQMEDLNAELKRTNQTLSAATPGSSTEVQARAEQQQLLTQINDLLAARNEVNTVDTTGGIVLTPAGKNTLYAQPSRTTTVVTGGAVGLVLGVILAYVRNPFDRKVRTPKEAASLVGAPLLGQVNQPKGMPELTEEAALRLTAERIGSTLQPETRLVIVDTTVTEGCSQTVLSLAQLLEQNSSDLFLSVPSVSDAAEVVAAMGSCDAVIVVFDVASADLGRLRWLRDEARRSATVVAGAVEIPRQAEGTPR
ncbi:MAG: Wzz/FepE/Etk N-terminal domain-containing protein [Galactobacter sp.]